MLDSGLCGCLSIVQGSHDLCPKREQKRFTNWGKRRKRLSVGSGNCVQSDDLRPVKRGNGGSG